MSVQEEVGGDFTRVASFSTPTEAHLLKGVLEAAGLSPRVADANFVQANMYMGQMVGGVRVLVPASQVGSARQVIAEFNAGEYQLQGEEATPPPRFEELRSPVFNPDRAALLSFFLTPVFGVAVQIANAPALGEGSPRIERWLWLVVLGVISVLGVGIAFRLNAGPMVIFRASLALSFITVVWYFLAGQKQSRQILATYGPNYARRNLVKPALFVAAVQAAVGWALTEFA